MGPCPSCRPIPPGCTTGTGRRPNPGLPWCSCTDSANTPALYHRYGFALNAAGIDLWAVDQLGHGLSPGDRGDFGTLADSSALAEALSVTVERERPGLPLIAAGHSFGSVVTLLRLVEQPQRYRAGSHLRCAAGADRRSAGRRHLTGSRSVLVVGGPVLSGRPGKRSAGFRPGRQRAAGAGTGRRLGPVRLRTPDADGAHAGRARRQRSDRADRSGARLRRADRGPGRSPSSPPPCTTSSTNPCTARSPRR